MSLRSYTSGERVEEGRMELESRIQHAMRPHIQAEIILGRDGADDENISKDTGENRLKVVKKEEAEPPEEQKTKEDLKELNSHDEEKMEDSTVFRVLTGNKSSKSEIFEAQDSEKIEIPSEATVKKAVWKRATYFRAESEEITLAGVRRLLEEDLQLDKYTLDPLKKLISTQIVEVLDSPKIPKSTNPVEKKSSLDTQSKTSKKTSSIESSDSLDDERDNEEHEETTKNKVVTEGKIQKSEGIKKHKRPSKEAPVPRKKQSRLSEEASEENSDKEDSGASSNDGRSRSTTVKTVKRKEVLPPAHGKQVEYLKSKIQSLGMSVAPSVYKKAKHVPYDKREAFVVKELEEILSKEVLSADPSEKDNMTFIVKKRYDSKVNARSDLKVLDEVFDNLDIAHRELFLASAFGKLYEIRQNISKSNVLTHVLGLLRINSPNKNEEELWFCIASQNVRFSFSDYTLITGLNPGSLEDFKDKFPKRNRLVEKYYPGKKKSLKREDLKNLFLDAIDMDDKLKFGLALVWESVLRADSPKLCIEIDVLDIVDELKVFNKYPWGTRSYPHLLNALKKMATSGAKTSVCNGFIVAIQVWLFEHFQYLGDLQNLYDFSKINNLEPKLPRMCNWKSFNNPSCDAILRILDTERAGVLFPLTPTEAEKEQLYIVEYESRFGDNWNRPFYIEDKGNQSPISHHATEDVDERPQDASPSLVVTSTTSTPPLSAILNYLKKLGQKMDDVRAEVKDLRTEVKVVDRKLDEFMNSFKDESEEQVQTPTHDSPIFVTMSPICSIPNASPNMSTTPALPTTSTTTLTLSTTSRIRRRKEPMKKSLLEKVLKVGDLSDYEKKLDEAKGRGRKRKCNRDILSVMKKRE